MPGRIDATRAPIAERLRYLEPSNEHRRERQDMEKCPKAVELLEVQTRVGVKRRTANGRLWRGKVG
jgi:hypothetical protein